jgi:hypothetical protein
MSDRLIESLINVSDVIAKGQGAIDVKTKSLAQKQEALNIQSEQKTKEEELKVFVENDEKTLHAMIDNARSQANESDKAGMILGVFTALVGNTSASTALAGNNDPVTKGIADWRKGVSALQATQRAYSQNISKLRREINKTTSEITALTDKQKDDHAIVDLMFKVQSHLSRVVWGLRLFSTFWRRLGQFLTRLTSQTQILKETFLPTVGLPDSQRHELLSHPVSLNRWVETRSMWQCLQEVSEDYATRYANANLSKMWEWINAPDRSKAKPDLLLVNLEALIPPLQEDG